MSWFSESGGFSTLRTGLRDDALKRGEVDLEAFTQNGFNPPELADYGPSETEIVLVLRDNRLGVTWKRFKVSLAQLPDRLPEYMPIGVDGGVPMGVDGGVE